ncbi:MAG: hypothetical protein JKX69_07455 [Rhodobacteraceae bacterium]|nr:hypothetical protein [Paracoccaceae bacterium]PHR56248.1 MAG: hypothetical protein COA47_13245 [Robiginitomaculum sp.]
MGPSDGSIFGLVKVHDGGSPADRLNMVIVADGYAAARMGQFQQDVNDFVAKFFATPPFNEEAIACGFNIYRLDVTFDRGGPLCGGRFAFCRL